MKLLTLNTHSLIEDNENQKLIETFQWIKEHEPDVIALQEVNQSIVSPLIYKNIRSDNYAHRMNELLNSNGLRYEWVWIPIKLGYSKYEEGVALFSKYPIQMIENNLLSKTQDFSNWKTRRALGIQCKVNNELIWFFTVHMGWWNDQEEPFVNHWNAIQNRLKKKKETIYLMGDFNSVDCVKNEGYDLITSQGWYDLYQTALNKDEGYTVQGKIDGWKDEKECKRIDYIFSNKNIKPKIHKTVFNGLDGPIVSDHFGIYVEE